MFFKKNYLMLQLCSFAKSTNILSLLKLIDLRVIPNSFQIAVKRWEKGETKRNNYKSYEKYKAFIRMLRYSKPEKHYFNELDIKITFDPFILENYNMRINSINGYLKISPKSCLWGDVYDYTLPQCSQESLRMTFKSLEDALNVNAIEKYPTVFIVIIDFNSNLNSFLDTDKPKLVEEAGQFLYDKIFTKQSEIDFFGCADIFNMLPVGDIAQSLPLETKKFNELEKKFDGIHDILINNSDLCKQVAEKTDVQASLIGENEICKGKKHGFVILPKIGKLDFSKLEGFFV